MACARDRRQSVLCLGMVLTSIWVARSIVSAATFPTTPCAHGTCRKCMCTVDSSAPPTGAVKTHVRGAGHANARCLPRASLTLLPVRSEDGGGPWRAGLKRTVDGQSPIQDFASAAMAACWAAARARPGTPTPPPAPTSAASHVPCLHAGVVEAFLRQAAWHAAAASHVWLCGGPTRCTATASQRLPRCLARWQRLER